jgi:hypothetical protein
MVEGMVTSVADMHARFSLVCRYSTHQHHRPRAFVCSVLVL